MKNKKQTAAEWGRFSPALLPAPVSISDTWVADERRWYTIRMYADGTQTVLPREVI